MTIARRVVTSAATISALTFCSRILGLVREYVFAHYFGTSGALSAFRIAFMLPNLARRLFGEGALSSAMIPVLTETLRDRGDDASRRFVGSLLTLLMMGLAVLVLVAEGVIAVWRYFHDDLAIELTAILLPYMLLICTVAVAGGVLNVRRHFFTPAAVPVILNVSVILGTVLGANWWGLSGVPLLHVACVSVLVGGVIQMMAIGVALKWIRFFPRFGGPLDRTRVRAVGVLMAPMVLGLSAVQLNALGDHVIAYLFVVEAGEAVGPAVLGYAQCLYQLPLGVFGIAIATAIFPILSQRAAGGDRTGTAAVLSRGIRLALFIALPSTVGLMFVATPLVGAVFEHGAFDAGRTGRVAGTLTFYSLGLVAYFIQHLLVRTFYALHESRTPARIAATMVVVNLTMNLTLVFQMEERGLALATSICAILQTIWLGVALRRRLPELAWRDIASGAVKVCIATAVMGAALALLTIPPVGPAIIEWRRIAVLALYIAVGVVFYAAAAWMLRVDEMKWPRRHK